MQLTITETTEKPILSRTEYLANLEYDKETPSGEQVKDALLAKAKLKDKKLIIIKKIDNIYGEHKAKVCAYAYSDKDSMMKIEGLKEKVAPKKEAEAKPAEETKAKEPDKKEEKPAEDAPAAEEKSE